MVSVSLLSLMLRTSDTNCRTVYALFGRHRALLGVLGTLFIAEVASLCYILAVVTPKLEYNDECYVTASPAIFQYYWYDHIDLSLIESH